jgi:chromosome segregation ATPase
MNLRLPVLALLLVAFPLFSHAQSLGDVAREVRVEKQKSGAPHARVITNDDLEATAPAEGAAPEKDASANATSDTAAAADASKAAMDASKPAADAKPEPSKAQPAKKDPEKERELRELETQKRSDELNKRYTDRITAIHEQINAAQMQLAKLQSEQINSTNEFKRTAGMSPTLNEYEVQQREFIEQIEAQKTLITSLNGQLEDAREAARHAGVPHASDY